MMVKAIKNRKIPFSEMMKHFPLEKYDSNTKKCDRCGSFDIVSIPSCTLRFEDCQEKHGGPEKCKIKNICKNCLWEW
jgi:hypothetical protein